MGQLINFCGTSVLDRTSGYVDRLLKETTDIHLNKNNVCTGGGFILNQAGSPTTITLPNKKQDQTEQVLDSAHQPYCLVTSYNRHIHHDVDRHVLSVSSPMTRAEMVLETLVYSPSDHLMHLQA
jgi:hypothetical protein